MHAYLVAQTVKNPPAMQEAWVQSLAWEDLLEEGIATYSCILAWKILMDRGFPRQESWSELPFPSPGIFPIQGLNPHLLHWELDSLPLSHVGSPPCLYTNIINFMCLQQFMHKICLQYQIDMLIVLFFLVNNFNKICWFSSEKIRGLRTPKQLSSEFSCTAVEPTYFSFFWRGGLL